MHWHMDTLLALTERDCFEFNLKLESQICDQVFSPGRIEPAGVGGERDRRKEERGGGWRKN